ncbi:CRE-UNC-76 protein [Echinococcus multilocularis]|uniref:CRE-UNC-76 protein n=1 Tax=Echinococcus multilocularis TaxID=6211 RepID=A0A0S4MM47_ECHMU|nr:CRE-UNC-76 protein [Echinococcus multilocularis]
MGNLDGTTRLARKRRRIFQPDRLTKDGRGMIDAQKLPGRRSSSALTYHAMRHSENGQISLTYLVLSSLPCHQLH